jgi:drug/metabolite transporter (DMT)-like permease
MDLKDIIESLALGAFVGCFILCLVEIMISLIAGPENISFSGTDIINGVLGSIVAGFGFSLPSFIYEREDIPLPIQVLFQMGIGMTVLFLIAIYLKWMPVTMGIGPIVTWVLIAFVFGAVFWCGFYIYYYLLARNLNKKIVGK